MPFPPTQHAVQLVGPETLVLNTHKEVPVPGPHEILVEIEAAARNHVVLALDDRLHVGGELVEGSLEGRGIHDRLELARARRSLAGAHSDWSIRRLCPRFLLHIVGGIGPFGGEEYPE